MPSNGLVTVEYSLGSSIDLELKVISIDGRVVETQSLSGLAGANRHVLNLSHLSKGMYHLEMSGDNVRVTRKLILN